MNGKDIKDKDDKPTLHNENLVKISIIMIEHYDYYDHYMTFDSMLHIQMNDNLTIIYNAD